MYEKFVILPSRLGIKISSSSSESESKIRCSRLLKISYAGRDSRGKS